MKEALGASRVSQGLHLLGADASRHESSPGRSGRTGGFLFFIFIFFFCFLGPHLRHMKVPRLGVELELQLRAYTTATAMQDLSLVFDRHHS